MGKVLWWLLVLAAIAVVIALIYVWAYVPEQKYK